MYRDEFKKLNTSNVTSFNCTFARMSAITSHDVSHFDTSNVTDMTNMFIYVAKNNSNFVLELGDKFTFKDDVVVSNFAKGCGSGKLVIPKIVIYIPNGAFKEMHKLNQIVFEQTSTSDIILPTAGSSSGVFYIGTSANTTITTSNDTIKNYDWSTDNRVVTFN